MKTLFAMILMVAMQFSAQAKKEEDKPVPEATLDQFTLGEVMNGVEFKPESLKGNPVVIEFWGARCPPCVASLPEMVKLQRRGEAKGLKVVGVHTQQVPDEDVLELLEKNRVKYPVLRYSGCPVEFSGIPTIFVFDRAGKLTWMGSPHDSKFDKAVREVMK